NYFFLNTRLPPFNNVSVRRAVNLAFDRQGLVALLGRAVAPTCQILPPNYPSFRQTCPYLPTGIAGLDKAHRLVRASGTTGQQVTVWAPGPIVVQGRYLVSVLKSLGYRARLHLISDPGKYFTRLDGSGNRMQAGFSGWASDFPSESSFIQGALECSSSGFCSPSIDRLLRHATTVETLNAPAARASWQRAERLILAQAPIVPMYNKQNVDLLSKRVGNYQYHPQWGALVDQLWVR
ncbi:MAG: ABC transporter substrate-binding protein, partial [Gaiellaceae bacterium]